jgi:hypothetical protein
MRRMINRLFFLLIAGLVISSCDTASNVDPVYRDYFIKNFGDDGDSEGIDMILNLDGTYTMLGNAISPGGKRRIFVVKADQEGNVVWHKKFGDGSEYAQDIEPISNGYIILSNVDKGTGGFYFKLIRIDDNGSKIDSLVYDVLTDQFARSVTPLINGGYYVVGNTRDTDASENTELTIPDFEDLLLVRFDNTFTKAGSFADRVGRSSVGSAIKVYENSNGSFTYVAYADELENGTTDVVYENNFIFRTFTSDPKNVPSTFVGDETKEEIIKRSFRSADGSIYAIGTAYSSPTTSTIFLAKARNSVTAPTKVYENDFGIGRLEGVSIYANNSSCLVLANRFDDADGTRDIWLTRVNAITGDQEPLWINGLSFGTTTNDDTGSVVIEVPNGDILILGTFNLTNQRKMALIKLKANGSF